MIGAILGDMIGSPYEFDRGNKSKVFPLFSRKSSFTDDSVMTIAICEAFMNLPKDAGDEEVREALCRSMRKYGHAFPYAGYGGMFRRWLHDPRVTGANLIAGTAQIVMEFCFDIRPDLVFTVPGTSEENCACGCFRAFDSLAVVMRNLCGQASCVTNIFDIIEEPCNRGDPHS